MATLLPLHQLAARQYGLAHRRQLQELGLSRSAIRHLVARGDWRWRTPAVLELAGAPASNEQRLMLAILDVPPGGAISHETAFARWRVAGFALFPIQATGVRGRRRYHSATIARLHEPRLLLPHHVVMLDGIPTTTPTRTLFDLAAVLHPQRVERALDNALAARLTSIALLQDMLQQLAVKGRRGITLMRSLLAARPAGYVPPASGLESRFQQLARRAGWWTFERQANVGDELSWLARVDFLDRERRVIVEVQSDRFHTALLDVQRDAQRKAALRAAGWVVVEVAEHDLWHDPDKVVRQLRALAGLR